MLLLPDRSARPLPRTAWPARRARRWGSSSRRSRWWGRPGSGWWRRTSPRPPPPPPAAGSGAATWRPQVSRYQPKCSTPASANVLFVENFSFLVVCCFLCMAKMNGWCIKDIWYWIGDVGPGSRCGDAQLSLIETSSEEMLLMGFYHRIPNTDLFAVCWNVFMFSRLKGNISSFHFLSTVKCFHNIKYILIIALMMKIPSKFHIKGRIVGITAKACKLLRELT